MRAMVLSCALLIPVALPEEPRAWLTGKITRAEQPKRRKPEIEVWNPWLTHWYTIETKTHLIKATEMVPPGVKRRPQWNVDREPAVSFKVGEEVKFAIQERAPGPNKPRELYVVDRNGKEHTLTIDEIVLKDAATTPLVVFTTQFVNKETSLTISDITQEEVEVLEDGVPQELAVFEAGKARLDLAILPAFERPQRRYALNELSDGDRVAVVASRRSTPILTQDRDAAAEQLRKAASKNSNDSSRLLDEIVRLSEMFPPPLASDEFRIKALLLLTDDRDYRSKCSQEDAIRSVLMNDVLLNAVLLRSVESEDLILTGREPSVRMPSPLSRVRSYSSIRPVVRASGGEMLFQGRDAFALRTAILHLRHRYLVGYHPRSPGGGGFRVLSLRLKAVPGLRTTNASMVIEARHKKGYFLDQTSVPGRPAPLR